MKVLVVGDIHGKWEMVNEAFDTFIKGHYDKIIFMGDIYDSFDRTDEDMIHCANVINAMLKTYPDRVVVIVGNHDEAYLRYNPEHFRCSGFRPMLHVKLHPQLLSMKKFYQYAYGIGNHLFTHAGVQYRWFSKHFNTLQNCADMMGVDITDPTHLWMVLDAVARTADSGIWKEKGPARRGMDSDYGSPMWCDLDEMLTNGPYPGLHQICGHTHTDLMYRFNRFEGNKKYKDTSVTYVDVLAHHMQFLTIHIDEND